MKQSFSQEQAKSACNVAHAADVAINGSGKRQTHFENALKILLTRISPAMTLALLVWGSGDILFAQTPAGATVPATQKIDIAKQPWLVESARIPEGMPYSPKPRQLWADFSSRFKTIREIVDGTIEIERWVIEPPKEMSGKFVLVEVWATWCPPCRRSLALLEFFHEKYKNELIVVSICETDENALKSMSDPLKPADLKAPLAVDTHRRFANALGVYGIPHAVLIEPVEGAILWEGMPTQIGYELNDERMGKILANLKNPNLIEKLPKTAPFQFKACLPDPNKPNEKPSAPVRCAGEDDHSCVP